MKPLPIALVLAILAPPAVAAEPVGRLFYTPDQRAQLDAARTKRARGAADKADDTPPPLPAPEIVNYGGMVRRSDGKTTVWLNNRAVTGKSSTDGRMLERIRPDGTVTLQSSQTGRQVDLRVGQRADLLTGRVDEGYRRIAPRPEDKADSSGPKPAPETAAPEAERKQSERERQENLDDAVRAMRDAAQARSATPPPQQPQESAGPVTVFPAPGPMQPPASVTGPVQLPAPGTVPAPVQYR